MDARPDRTDARCFPTAKQQTRRDTSGVLRPERFQEVILRCYAKDERSGLRIDEYGFPLTCDLGTGSGESARFKKHSAPFCRLCPSLSAPRTRKTTLPFPLNNPMKSWSCPKGLPLLALRALLAHPSWTNPSRYPEVNPQTFHHPSPSPTCRRVVDQVPISVRGALPRPMQGNPIRSPPALNLRLDNHPIARRGQGSRMEMEMEALTGREE